MMTLLELVLLCFSHFLLLLLLLLPHAASGTSSTLELSTGLRLSPLSMTMPKYTMYSGNRSNMLDFVSKFTVVIPASQKRWFLPILSSPSFNSSNSSQSPGFSFGFFFNGHDVMYLAVCGGLSGNFSNSTVNYSYVTMQLPGDKDLPPSLSMPVVRDGYAVPVWIANPFAPLTSYNASLVVVEDAGGTKHLQLEDHNGTVLWNVGNVGLMEMEDKGTLTIYDTINRTKVVWQSSRDTLFRGEKLGVGMQLTSNDSSYSARMEKGGLVLYLNTVQFMGEQPAPYWAIPALLNNSDNPLNVSNKVMSSPCRGAISDTAYAFLGEDFSLNIYPGPCSQYRPLSMAGGPYPSIETDIIYGPLSFVKLENDGWLRNYAVPLDLAAKQPYTIVKEEPLLLQMWDQYYVNVNVDILQVSLLERCIVPKACGPFGVCTPYAADLCRCPTDPSSSQSTSAFHAIDENDYSKGCTHNKNLPTCTKDEHVNTTDFLQLDHIVSTFLFSGWTFNSTPAKVDTCMTMCSSKCSCNGFFYQANNAACFFITDEMSLLNLTKDYRSEDWPVDILNNNYVTYLKKVKVDQIGQPSPSSPAGLGKSTVIAIAIASSFSACVGLVITMLLHSRARRRRLLNKQASQAEEQLREVLPLLPSRFSYQDLHEATDGFSKLLGAGGCGSVYAGMLQDGRKVAVKTLEFSMKDHAKQFLAEVATIGQTSHHNIVRLVGFCWEVSSRMLVYEYMERGSLDNWLFHKPRIGASCDDGAAPLLDWRTRYNVVLGIVRGLSYLHEECPQPILHFDIKPQNILLDGTFVAKLADFGMSRLMQRDVSEVVTGLRGTPGYIAPEWLLHGAVSKKGDIYSMGMVMLEIVGGRKNVDLALLNNVHAGLDDGEWHEPWHFPSWAARKCEQDLEMELVDKRLQGAFNEVEARRLIYTAFWCIQKDPVMRPYAPTALQWLEGSSPVKQPPFSSASHSSFSSESSSQFFSALGR